MCACSPAASTRLPHFDDVETAPSAIRTAARAVVRVGTSGQVATGSFISPTGLLLTNNHVLGVPICPIEGCSLEITRLYQRGSPPPQAERVFGIPTSVDEGLDMAVVQLFDTRAGAMLSTPDYLRWALHSPTALLGSHVTIVGHPEGGLKKWTDGIVYDVEGDWVRSDAYILPGNSGSPLLDDDGELVGLAHHAVSGEDLIAGDAVNVALDATASAPLHAALGNPLPASMISVGESTTADQVLANQAVYLNADTATALVDGNPDGILDLLSTACDAALAAPATETIDQLAGVLAPCTEAASWIECRSDATPTSSAETCPAVPGDWARRYQEVDQTELGDDDQPDLYLASFATAALSTSVAAGLAAGSSALVAMLTTAGAPLDFNVANYLAAFQVRTYGGQDVAAYVEGYRDVPDFRSSAATIFSAGAWLSNQGVLSASTLQGIWAKLSSDPEVDVHDELYLEGYAYRAGWIR